MQPLACILIFAWLIGASVFSALAHGKPLSGRADCRPVIAAAVFEAILISIAIWG